MQFIRIDKKVIKMVFQFRAPVEMHLVHYKSSYGPDFNTALANNNNTWDTLAVLGVMFRLQSEDNPNLNNIITGDLIILIRSIKKYITEEWLIYVFLKFLVRTMISFCSLKIH
jgi:hypothetical protein